MKTKKCYTCKRRLAYSSFSISKANKDGLLGSCKKCDIIKSKTFRINNPEKVKHRKLMYSFGIGLDQYNDLMAAQGGVCAICKNKETSKDFRTNKERKLAVDHCHSSLVIRGLLCGKCNRFLGYAQDNIDILCHAIIYLNKSNKLGAA